MNTPNAAAAGTLSIGKELIVNRLGFGAMRLTGEGRSKHQGNLLKTKHRKFAGFHHLWVSLQAHPRQRGSVNFSDLRHFFASLTHG